MNIAQDGKCTPVARGSWINNDVLSANRAVRLWLEHDVLDSIEQLDETADEEMDEVSVSTVAPGEYMGIRVRLDARQYGIYDCPSDGSSRRVMEKPIQIRSVKLLKGARFEILKSS